MVNTKYNVQDTIHCATEFVETVLEDGFIPPGYTLEDVEKLHDGLQSCWEQIEDDG